MYVSERTLNLKKIPKNLPKKFYAVFFKFKVLYNCVNFRRLEMGDPVYSKSNLNNIHKVIILSKTWYFTFTFRAIVLHTM